MNKGVGVVPSRSPSFSHGNSLLLNPTETLATQATPAAVGYFDYFGSVKQ